MPTYTDILTFLSNGTIDLLTANIVMGQMMTLGFTFCAGLAAVRFSFVCVHVMMHHQEDLSEVGYKIGAALVSIAFVYELVYYYNTPIPGIGLTDWEIVVKSCEGLSKTIMGNSTSIIMQRLQLTQAQLQSPIVSLFNLDIKGVLAFICWLVLIWIASAIVFVVSMYGYFKLALAVACGPLFIPWLMVRGPDRYYWSWQSWFLQAAFYQVMAAMELRVVSNVLIPAFDMVPGYKSVTVQITTFPLFFAAIVLCLYGLLRTSDHVSHLFSGSSSGNFGNFTGAVIGRIMG